eukprot:1157544-Pelagomonas_calceolata.AAC.1
MGPPFELKLKILLIIFWEPFELVVEVRYISHDETHTTRSQVWIPRTHPACWRDVCHFGRLPLPLPLLLLLSLLPCTERQLVGHALPELHDPARARACMCVCEEECAIVCDPEPAMPWTGE